MVFQYHHNHAPPKPSNIDNYYWLWDFWEDVYENQGRKNITIFLTPKMTSQYLPNYFLVYFDKSLV